MVILETVKIPGGAITIPRTSASLKQSAQEWLDGAEIYFTEAQSQLGDGNLDEAIRQTRFTETKLAAARMRMVEARELEAMGNGS